MKILQKVWRPAIGLWIAGALAATWPALAAPANSPVPGTLNYIEGQVALNGRALDSKSAGADIVNPGTMLSTRSGKVEMLLTPGVFLRLGENSEMRMVSAGLADTEVALTKGQASIEADYLLKDNHLVVDQGVDQGKVSTTVQKNGLYVFNTAQPFTQVLDGKAEVSLDDRHVSLGKDREAVMDLSGKLKTQSFNGKQVQDESLVRWSQLRSAYEAQANADTVRTVVVDNSWYGPGWYWDQGFGFWSFLPGDGILYSPFGWGFYSPVVFFNGPGFYNRPGFVSRPYSYGRVPSAGFSHAPSAGFRGGFAARGGGGARGR